jgi:hypothetical protein
MLSELLLAHQGGWDEIVFIAAPVVVFAGLLVVAKHRAQLMADETASEADDDL